MKSPVAKRQANARELAKEKFKDRTRRDYFATPLEHEKLKETLVKSRGSG